MAACCLWNAMSGGRLPFAYLGNERERAREGRAGVRKGFSDAFISHHIICRLGKLGRCQITVFSIRIVVTILDILNKIL
jgi:hypothetical protein